MPEPIIVALIALSGAMVGAVLQAALTRSFEKSKFIRDNRRAAYQDFLTSLADLSLHDPSSPEHRKAKALLAETRCRIALFGSKNVVQLLADIFVNSTTFENPMDQYRLYQVILEMRRDSIGWKDRGIKVDLHLLIFASAGKDEE